MLCDRARVCSRMQPSEIICSLLLLFLSVLAHGIAEEPVYLLAVTSQPVGGTTETLCLTVKPVGHLSLVVTLEHNQHSVILLQKHAITAEFYICVPFKVPIVSEVSVASIKIQMKGANTFLEKETRILISPPKELIIIQTDKPIYKPGQTVKFRMVSLNTNFLTYNQRFSTIEVQDPISNRIGQWLNVNTSSGLVDLSYPINSEATKGIYVITAWDEKKNAVSQSFEVKDYVLPTFEVTVQLPSVVTIMDTYATLRVCAKYTYGKPVNGMVRAKLCRKSYRFWWFSPDFSVVNDICMKYKMTTDKTGCGVRTLNLHDFALIDSRYEPLITAECEVEEYGTGVILTGSASSSITSNMVTLSFEDSPTVFKLGLPFEGKVKVTGPKSNPLRQKEVYLILRYADKNAVQKLITNDAGIAQFSLDTESWGLDSVTLEAHYETTNRPIEYGINQLTPYYPIAYLWLQPFYSQSHSFIKLISRSVPFSCSKNGIIRAQYLIQQSTLLPSQDSLSFFFMVMNKGQLVQRGRIRETIVPGTAVHKGSLVVTLHKMLKVTPVAQVVVYTILPSGEALADSMNYPIQLCLANKVSLKFSSSSELPGDETLLMLKAAPGSLCSVKAIDQSLLLLQPETELSVNSVFNMLPVQYLSGYPYNINEEDWNPCWMRPPIWNVPFVEQWQKSIAYFPNSEKVDVYNTFKDIGIKILTNADIKKPLECMYIMPTMTTSIPNLAEFPVAATMAETMPMFAREPMADAAVVSNQPVVTIRKFFPETWIWDLVSVSPSGKITVNKTVPDSITTWQADAFCTSPVGFGVAPKTNLVAFQPFFVSVTMPSSVIRGEVFTLKATVFNYLQSCMMVNMALADSNQFSVKVCEDCVYTRCLCADESWTCSWIITPLVLGEVSINVTAEAVQSSVPCGKDAVIVPEKGRIDSVIKPLLVQAEGTKEYKSYNELLCPSGVMEKVVSLTLPQVFVEGSPAASVSVLGDLMGRALQNLAELLVMPGGCGEQNMLGFSPNIYILQYLESTNQLTPAIMDRASTYLVTGYQTELTYKHYDGSYSAFGMSDPSGNTWLTAFVMKSFGSAMRYIFVDQMFVDQAKVWLGQHQQSNGCFASVGQLFHTDMKGGVNDEVTLSAYVTAAMLELSYTITDPVVENGLNCLRNTYSQVNSTYAKALLFYTFTLAGDQAMRGSLISALNAEAIISGGGRHWSRTNDGSLTDSLEVEMTSYVLLALMSGPELPGFGIGYSVSIVHWLSQQQSSFGGFASTQDTVVALQALAKYSQVTYSPAGAVTVTVTSPSGVSYTFAIDQSNRLLYQEAQLQEVPGDYSIRAEGEGCVYVQFNLRYNIPPPPDHSSFIISASAFGNCRVPTPSLNLTVPVMYKGRRLRTNMVLIDIRPLSGFRVDKDSVQLVNGNSDSSDGAVKRVDQTEGRAIIYLNELTNGKEMVYTMMIMQDLPVENLKPAVVKVYDYYETSENAVTEYTSPCPVQ